MELGEALGSHAAKHIVEDVIVALARLGVRDARLFEEIGGDRRALDLCRPVEEHLEELAEARAASRTPRGATCERCGNAREWAGGGEALVWRIARA